MENHRRRQVHIGGGTLARVAIAVVVLAVFLGTSAAARAEDREARELEAKRACLASRPEHGIEILAGLYAETNDPTYIYNQARCFEQNGRAQDAVTRFREYLRKTPALAADERAQVQARIAELEQQLRQGAGTPPVATAGTATSGGPGDGGSVSASPAAVAVAGGDRSADDVSAHRLRLAGIVTASVGAAALAGGLFMGWRAKSLSEEVTNDARNQMFSRSKEEAGQRAETLQWIGYGVGGAALIGGALLYYVGTARKADSPTTTALLPVLTPGLAGACLRVRF